VQMLWDEGRGHSTFGAVQRLPKELPHVATTCTLSVGINILESHSEALHFNWRNSAGSDGLRRSDLRITQSPPMLYVNAP